MALKLDCRKFAPNIFNKTKCQNCFRPKDAHSAAALESNRLSRKVCKCGYLFVAPDLDFSNPVNKTKRWQRRWFVLYDDGEFTFCVDDHPETVPQCIIDMNQCQDVSEAEEVTGHQYSISLSIPDKIYYIKANSQEEINWWFDALLIYPRSLINKNWKTTLAPATQKQEEEQNKQEGKLDVSEIAKIPQDLNKTCVKTEAVNSRTASLDLFVELPKLISVEQSEDIPLFPQEIINCQDVVSTSGSFLNETDESSVSDNLHKNTGVMQSSMNSNNISNSNYMSSSSVKSIFNKSSDPSGTVDDTLTRSRYRGKRAGILYRRSKSDGVARMFPTDITSSDSKPKYLYEVLSTPDPPKAKLKNPVYLLLSDAPIAKHIETFEKLQDKHPKKSDVTDTIKKGAGLTAKLIDGFERRNSVSRITPRMVRSGRGINGSDLPARRSRSLTRDPGQYQDSSHGSSGMAEYQYYSSRSATHSPERWDLTDSLKSRSPEKLQKEEKNIEYLKKGWLLKKDGTQESWAKHWFVLSSTTLMYYSEPQAETEGRPDGGIDLKTIQKVQEIDVSRNYGFEISTNDGLPLVLSATTLGIRSHWIEALETALKEPVDKTLTSVFDVKALTEKLQPELQRERKRETAKCRPRRLDLEKVIMSDNLQQDSTSKSSPNADAHSGVEEIAVKFSDAVDSQEDELLQNKNNEINGLLKQPSSPPPSKTPISLIKERSKMRSPFKIKNSHDSSHSADEKSSTVTCIQNQKSQLITEEENEKPVILHISEKNEKELNLISELSENDLSFDKKNDNKAASENMVVELLETEVESLKAQLEHTQSEMAKTYDANTELKAKLKALRRDHYDSFTELENEHSKYLLQIEDVNRCKDDIELENVRLHNCLTEVKTQSDLSTVQIKMLKENLKEGREIIRRQQLEIEGLKTKLDISVSELTETECALSESLTNIKFEKEKFLKLTEDWSKRFKNMEIQLKDTLLELEQRSIEIREKRDKLKHMKTLEQKHHHAIQKLTNLIKKFEESESLRKKYKKEKDDLEKKLNDAENRLKQLLQLGGSISPMSPLSPLSEDQNISKLEEALSNTEPTDFNINHLMYKNEMWELKEELKKVCDENSSLKSGYEKEINIRQTLKVLMQEKDNKIESLQKLIENQKEELLVFKNTVEKENSRLIVNLIYKYEGCLKEMEDLSRKFQDMQIKETWENSTPEKQKIEFSEMNKTVQQMQDKLKETELLIKNCSLFGINKNISFEKLHRLDDDATDSEIKKKFHAAINEIRQLSKLLKEANSSIDNLEIANVNLKQEVQAIKNQHNDQIALMGARIEDLTSKLMNSEKNARRLEQTLVKSESKSTKRIDSDKELEKIENKVNEIEQTLASQKNETYLQDQIKVVQDMFSDIEEQSIVKSIKNTKEKDCDLPSLGNASIESHSSVSTPTSTPTKRDHKVQVNLDRRKRTSDLGLKKLPRMESLLKSLQKQLVGLVEGVMAIKKGDKDNDPVRSLEQKVAGMMQEVQQFKSKWASAAFSQEAQPSVSNVLHGKSIISEQVWQFAEKMAFEAILLGELAYIALKRTQVSKNNENNKEVNQNRLQLNRNIEEFSSKIAGQILVQAETVSHSKESLKCVTENAFHLHGAEMFNSLHACERSMIRLLPVMEEFANTIAFNGLLMSIYSFLNEIVKKLSVSEENVTETLKQNQTDILTKKSEIKDCFTLLHPSSTCCENHNKSASSVGQCSVHKSHNVARNVDAELVNTEMVKFMNKFFYMYKDILMENQIAEEKCPKTSDYEKRFAHIEKRLKKEMNKAVENVCTHYEEQIKHFKKTYTSDLTELIAQKVDAKYFSCERQLAVKQEISKDNENKFQTDYFQHVTKYANSFVKEVIQQAELVYIIKQMKKKQFQSTEDKKEVGAADCSQPDTSESETTEDIANIRMRYEEILNLEKNEFNHALQRVEAELQRVKQKPDISERISIQDCVVDSADKNHGFSCDQQSKEKKCSATKSQGSQTFADISSNADVAMKQRIDELSAAVVDLLHSDKPSSQNCKHSDDEPQELSGENQTDVQLKSRIKELEEQLNSFQSLHIDQIQSLKAAYELEISKSSDYSIDHDAIRQKYVAEINMLKAFFEKHIQTTEQSHRHIIEELKTQHHNDIEQMRIEKEQALAEETKATISALEAMRKAHQSEMERELTRLKEISVNQASKLDLSGSYNDEVLESIREEIQQLSEKYSLKCMEIAALEELVEIQKKSLDKLRKRIVDLITKNEELVTQVASKTLMTDAEKENLSEKIKVVQELQEMLRDKENEVIMLKRTVLELQQEIHFLKIDRNKESSSSSIDVSFVNSSPVVTKPPLPSSLGTILKQRASIVKELHPPECNSPSEEVDASSSSSEIKQTKIPIAVKEKETRKANGNNSSLKDRSRSPGRKVDSQRSKKSFQDRTSESLTRL